MFFRKKPAADADVQRAPKPAAQRPFKVLAVCGSGLGSSFLVHMNLERAFTACGAQGVEVDHSDVSSLAPGEADVVVTARDLADAVSATLAGGSTRIVVLDSIIDSDEIQGKVEKLVVEFHLKG